MIRTVLVPVLSGIAATILHVWWLFLLVLGAKAGPRIARGIIIRRGGLR